MTGSADVSVFGDGVDQARPQRRGSVVAHVLDQQESGAGHQLVGSIHAGTKSNVIEDHAVLELNVRTYDEETRSTVLDAIRRIVTAECQASGSPRQPEFELFDRFPATLNDATTTERVRAAFVDHFGKEAQELDLQSASEDFSDIPNALGVPYTYWGVGGVDPETYRAAAAAGRLAQDIPVNHSPFFAPVLQPTLDTGTSAMVVAALAWLAPTPVDEVRGQ